MKGCVTKQERGEKVIRASLNRNSLRDKWYVNRKCIQMYLWEKASLRQDNVAGSLRCSWEGRRRGCEQRGVCVCVERERDWSVQARESVWWGREGSVSQSQHLSSLHQGWGTLHPLASLAADLTHFHQRSHPPLFLPFIFTCCFGQMHCIHILQCARIWGIIN